MSYEEAVNQFRKQKDEFFKKSSQSPLTPAQRDKFEALSYFPPDINFRYEVEIVAYEKQKRIMIQTSKGIPQEYIRYGYIEFTVNDQICRLTVYKSEDSDYFFIPFKDKTTGKETYDAGRYIEVEHIKKNKYVLDFNFAYNPYCAYNENWICPLTPFENNLQCAITAGEKKFH